MRVEVLDDLSGLDRIRDDWERVYERDPNSNVFVSWAWTRALLTVMPRRWFILLVRNNDDQFVAFLPLASEAFPRWGPRLERDIFLAGNPMADLNGMLALPSSQEAAITALSHHLRAMPWGTFQATDVSDPRLVQLFASLPHDDFRPVTFVKKDAAPCPFLRLPSSWDEYLMTISKRFRHLLRTSIRRVSEVPGFRMEVGTVANIEGHVESCIRLSEMRWRNGRVYRTQQRALLLECFRTGCLWSLMLWSGRQPVAVLLALVDGRSCVFATYKAAFNPQFADLRPGIAVAGLAIQHAINHGFTVYDFLRGGETYKLRFGCDIRYTRHLAVMRTGPRHEFLYGVRRGVYFAERAFARTQRALAG